MRLAAALLVLAILLVPSGAPAQTKLRDLAPNESCTASDPGMPTCTVTITRDSNTPISGAAGVGKWKVVIKRGKAKIILTSPASGEPTASSADLFAGDKIKATAIGTGSVVTTGTLNTP